MPLTALAALLPVLSVSLAADAFTSEGERSGYVRTGRYDEVERICAAAAAADPRRVRCLKLGRTPEGRELVAIVASQDGVLAPDEARRRGRPVILVQGGIHAGEIEGKDAIFLALRELLGGQMAPGALGAVTAVFVPVFNVDGHERFGPNNRPNQRGPVEMGFRATAQNLNLNRDYVKADAPEMRLMLGLVAAWEPVVYVDLHTTDGAKFQHDLSVTVTPDTPRADDLGAVAGKLSAAIQERLTALRHLPLDFYPDLRKPDDPGAGFENGNTPPRYSDAYAAARNRIGVLVETHSWHSYRERVLATRDALAALFERAVAGAAGWQAAEREADAREARLARTDVVLTVEPDGTARTIDFKGYAYRVSRSEVSGASWIEYDERKPQVWRVPVYDRMRPLLVVRAPGAGYLVPAPHAAVVADRLRLHGLRFETVGKPLAGLAVEGFHITKLAYDKPFEGRLPVNLTGRWEQTRRDLPAGSLFVPIEQPSALLVMHLLEPQAPDSLVAWGFFNAMFERKEYMEDYVLEAEARKLLAADPSLKAELERRVREDPAFAASPERRLEMFYRRLPAWDQEREWAPIYRVDAAPR